MQEITHDHHKSSWNFTFLYQITCSGNLVSSTSKDLEGPNFMGIHPVVVNTLHLNSHLMKSQDVTEVGRIHPLGTTNACR